MFVNRNVVLNLLYYSDYYKDTADILRVHVSFFLLQVKAALSTGQTLSLCLWLAQMKESWLWPHSAHMSLSPSSTPLKTEKAARWWCRSLHHSAVVETETDERSPTAFSLIDTKIYLQCNYTTNDTSVRNIWLYSIYYINYWFTL